MSHMLRRRIQRAGVRKRGERFPAPRDRMAYGINVSTARQTDRPSHMADCNRSRRTSPTRGACHERVGSTLSALSVPMMATSRELQRVEVMNRAAVPETLRPILHIWQCPNCNIARPRFDPDSQAGAVTRVRRSVAAR